MVTANNLAYRADKRYLVKDVTFTQPQGGILAVLGANGAGKSTLLKLLCGDMRPHSGEVAYHNASIANRSLRQMALARAVLAQHNTVTMPLNAAEIVQMGLYNVAGHLPHHEAQALVNEALENTGAAELAGRAYATLSGGEQQRVQLARVLAQINKNPKGILFLDEPTNNLDINHQHQILHLVKKFTKNGLTVITVLHDINLAARFADNILLMHNGSPVAYGTPLEVVTCENIHKTFNIEVDLLPCKGLQCPLVVPAVYA